MQEDGWIKLHRKVMDSKVWASPDLFKIWTACLLQATHKETWVHMEGLTEPLKICPGQFVTGRYSLWKICYPKSRNSDPSPMTVWRWLHLLQDMQNVTIKSSNKFSLVTITNWEIYQNKESQNGQQNEQQLSSRCAADEQQMSTNKNDKNVKNINTASRLFRNSSVFELQTFKSRLTGWPDEKVHYYHQAALDWSNSKGVKRLDWIATVRNWDRMRPNEWRKLAGHAAAEQKSRDWEGIV